jgi:hypothetical protein
MTYLIIILAIVIVVLIYYIYSVLTRPPRLGNRIDLTKVPVTILPSAIKNPYSINYTISTWVYIHNFPQNNNIERFIMYGDAEHSGPNSMWSLRMDLNTPTLFCDILANNEDSGNYVESIKLTDNFPIQKWVYITTVVSFGYIECYLNGAFVLAQSLDTGVYQVNPPSNPDKWATFTFGALGTTMDNGRSRENGCPVVLNLVSRWDYRLSAGDVYNNYNKGNGEPINMFGPAYKMNINLERGNDKYVLPVF